MKNKLKIILCALLIGQFGLSAQNKDGIPDRHEWRFGVAGFPFMDIMMYSDGIGYDMIDPYVYYLDPDWLYRDYHGTRRMFGLVTAEYSINLKKHFTFAVGAYLSTGWNKVYEYDGTNKGSQLGFGLTIMPTARFKYISREAFNLYGSVGLGVMAGTFEEGLYAYPTFQLVPVGLTFGRKIYGFAEIGAGMLYIGGNVGMGFRF